MVKRPTTAFFGMHVCGMNRYSRCTISVGETFKLVRKVNNNFDSSAIAAKDGARTIAHVSRHHANKLVANFNGSFATDI